MNAYKFMNCRQRETFNKIMTFNYYTFHESNIQNSLKVNDINKIPYIREVYFIYNCKRGIMW